MDDLKEERAKSVSMGFCENHLAFVRERDRLLEVQEDKMMDIWKMTKEELYKIVMNSQEVILEHISGLKDMVTNFLSTTARTTERHDKEIEALTTRLIKLEQKYHNNRKEDKK